MGTTQSISQGSRTAGDGLHGLTATQYQQLVDLLQHKESGLGVKVIEPVANQALFLLQSSMKKVQEFYVI
jgi:hypothetical protein